MFSGQCSHGVLRCLQKRDLNSKSVTFLVIAGGLILLALSAFSIVWLAKLRKRRRQRQPSDLQKQPSRWQFWGRQRSSRSGYEQTPADGLGSEAQIHPLQPRVIASNRRDEQQSQATGRNASQTHNGHSVDRNTSVRSVMTLPAYRATAGNNEQVLGREGDRDGVDTIVDLPTAEAEETMRDEEMNAIYQIRVARRQQIADREELRRQRLEARQTGNRAALANARAQVRTTSNSNNLDQLRGEVTRIQEQRQRSVSSVSYGDLGVARHDGTRLRASSNDSERMGLLSDAASIAISTRSDRTSPGSHHRGRSTSSVASMDDDAGIADQSRSRSYSHCSTPRLSSGDLGTRSSPELGAPTRDGEGVPPPEYHDINLEDAGGGYNSQTQANDSPPNYSISSGSVSNTVAAADVFLGAEMGDRQQTNTAINDAPQLTNSQISRVPAIVINSSNDR